MIGVWAKIEASSDVVLQYISDMSFFENNISQPIEQSLNTTHPSSNPYLLGCSDFSMGAELVDDTVPYFIGNVAANEDGAFGNGVVYQLSVQSENPERSTTITITFDTYNNQYPQSIVILTDDGEAETYEVTGSSQTFVTNPTSSWAIAISNWNTPNFPLRIQGIDTNTLIEIPQGSLIDLQFSGMDRSDYKQPSYGIYTNSGSIEFIEKSNKIKPLKEAGRLLNSKIEFYFSNRYKDTIIGTFYISEGDYSQTSNRVTLHFKDKIEKWQEITLPKDQVLEMGSWPVETLRQTISGQVEGLDIVTYYGNQSTTTRWNMTRISAPYLFSSSFWAFMTKCCEVTGSYIFCDEKGRAAIYFGGGT